MPVLKAMNPADYLAALPRLTGMSAPDSCFITLLKDGRTQGSARNDLPSVELINDEGPELLAWMTQTMELASRGEAVMMSFHTTEALTAAPAESPYGRLALLMRHSAEILNINMLGMFVVGADEWTSFPERDSASKLRSLDLITQSTLHDAEAQAVSVDEWRAQHAFSLLRAIAVTGAWVRSAPAPSNRLHKRWRQRPCGKEPK